MKFWILLVACPGRRLESGSAMIFRHMNGFIQHTNPSCFLRQPQRILQCRLVMDPERFPDDRDEAMAAKGMGAVYVSTSDGRDWEQRNLVPEIGKVSCMISTGPIPMLCKMSSRRNLTSSKCACSSILTRSLRKLCLMKIRILRDRTYALVMTYSTNPRNWSIFSRSFVSSRVWQLPSTNLSPSHTCSHVITIRIEGLSPSWSRLTDRYTWTKRLGHT